MVKLIKIRSFTYHCWENCTCLPARQCCFIRGTFSLSFAWNFLFWAFSGFIQHLKEKLIRTIHALHIVIWHLTQCVARAWKYTVQFERKGLMKVEVSGYNISRNKKYLVTTHKTLSFLINTVSYFETLKKVFLIAKPMVFFLLSGDYLPFILTFSLRCPSATWKGQLFWH